MTTDENTPGGQTGEAIPLPPRPPAALPPGRLVRLGHDRLPEALAPEPFTDEQVEFITMAALLTPREDVSPEELNRAARQFFMTSVNATTWRDRQARWEAALTKAVDLFEAIQSLTDDEYIYVALEGFCADAAKAIDAFDGMKDSLRGKRQPRVNALATLELTIDLAAEFERLYEQPPTATFTGAFSLFADAFLESLKDNAPGDSEVELPKGATLCRRLKEVLSLK